MEKLIKAIFLADGMVDYPAYVDAYGKIKDLFKKIKEAAVPAKVTTDFVYTVLGLKSTSYRAMIPLLKRMGFIDEANVPTASYRDYRDDSKSKRVMAQRIKVAYVDLFSINEFAHKLKRDEIISKLNTRLGTSKDDKTIPKVAATFLEFCSLADFETEIPETPKESIAAETLEKPMDIEQGQRLGISYTINLNLPATTEIEVFNVIFKSLKENILK